MRCDRREGGAERKIEAVRRREKVPDCHRQGARQRGIKGGVKGGTGRGGTRTKDNIGERERWIASLNPPKEFCVTRKAIGAEKESGGGIAGLAQNDRV